MNKSLVLLHGLNNAPDIMQPFAEHFKDKGFNIHQFNLYGHKKDAPLKTLTLKESLHHLHYQMLKVPKENEVYFIGFSQGALIFQLYQMMKLCQHTIKSQVLLAPAFYLKKQSIIFSLARVLPATAQVTSRTPKEFRCFDKLNLGYYRLLFEQTRIFQKHDIKELEKIPTLVLSDAKDGVVDINKLHAETLKSNLDQWKIVYLNRDLKHTQLPFPSATFLHHNFIRCLPVKTFHRAVINLKLNLPDRFVADVF